MELRKAALYTVVLCCSVLLSDSADGSRGVHVHVITLYDNQGFVVFPDDERTEPFSTRQTCGGCHDYNKISSGRHFNAARADVEAGRVGEPWIYWDAKTATQIPLSYRPWPGTFRPEQIGLTSWWFTRIFGRHMPGGGVGEEVPDEPDPKDRWGLSGKLQINCLSCHNADSSHDQAEYAQQVSRHNFRWAAAASSGLASVRGSAKNLPDFWVPGDRIEGTPSVFYDSSRFLPGNKVFFDIVREVPAQRCYFCHSSRDTGAGWEKWEVDEDVHISAGLTCVDCHRNGLDHDITRGYEGEAADRQEPSVATLSCKGCHIVGDLKIPLAGRLGAPQPKHKGLPPVHFEKLTCTTCHSGPWPGEKAKFIKTSRAHGLGTYRAGRTEETLGGPALQKDRKAGILPHIQSPVFVRGSDGKIGPHKLLWPAFWGRLTDESVTPIAPEFVEEAAGKMLSHRLELPASGSWPNLNTQQIAQVLTVLSSQESADGEAVYICGGKVYGLSGRGQLLEEDHPAAAPYSWPIAHDVRPAAQSLGVRGCSDCHSVDAPFFFGEVAVDSPVTSEKDSVKKMFEFEGVGPVYTKMFAASFVFRPWLKMVVLASGAVLAAVLLLYGLKALACVVKVLAEKN